MKLAAFGGALLAASTAAVWADAGPPVLTLDEAVRIGVERNRELAATAARAAASRESLAEARSYRLPRVSLAGDVSRTTNPALVFSNLLGQEEFAVANFEIDSLNEPDALNNFRGAFVVEQPLWTGGRVRSGIDAAASASQASDLRLERTRQEVVRRVIAAYADAVLADRQIEVARDALETAQANVEVVSDLHSGGLVVRSDLLQARVRASEVEEMVARGESAVEVSRASLNLVLGRDLATGFALPETIEPASLPDEPLEALVERAHVERADLRAADGDVRVAGLLATQARAGRRGDLGLQGRYESNAEDFFGADGTNWSIFVGGRWTLFDGHATGARVRQAGEREREVTVRREQLALAVDLEVRRSFYELRAAGKRLEQTRLAIELAEDSLEIVRDRYREGLATWVELREAETLLTGARVRDVAARRDALLARASLDLAVGRL